MKRIFKNIALLFSVLFLVSCGKNATTFERVDGPNDKDIRIVFTNDIHCGFRDNLGIPKLYKYYNDIDDYKLLVDAGDFSQGDLLGTIGKGIYTYELMNELGYDFIIPGNHEFDRKVPSFLSSSIELTGTMFCCNFFDIKNNQLVFDPYKIFRLGNKNVALVGVLSPDTIRTTSYTYYQDEKGNYLYSFMQENGLDGFANNIQKYVDDARNNGADYVVLVMHMGDIVTSVDYTSADVISKLNGVDAVIDGHSHNKYNLLVKDKDGKEVPLAQTGTKLESIGDLTISKDGNVKIELVENINEKSLEAEKIINDVYERLESELAEVLKKDVPFDLTTDDPTTGKRLVRSGETNLGDFCADALRDKTGSDIAIINGGGVRSSIKKGDITLKNIYEVFPFSNTVSTVMVTGKIFKDIIEFGTYVWPVENGAFFQVSGVTFSLDSTKKSNVVVDENGVFKSVDGEYRVRDIMVNGEPLDENKNYTLTALSYFTENYGNGCSMFKGLPVEKSNICFDADALIDYTKKVDIMKYENPYGDGRINIIVE